MDHLQVTWGTGSACGVASRLSSALPASWGRTASNSSGPKDRTRNSRRGSEILHPRYLTRALFSKAGYSDKKQPIGDLAVGQPGRDRHRDLAFPAADRPAGGPRHTRAPASPCARAADSTSLPRWPVRACSPAASAASATANGVFNVAASSSSLALCERSPNRTAVCSAHLHSVHPGLVRDLRGTHRVHPGGRGLADGRPLPGPGQLKFRQEHRDLRSVGLLRTV